MKMEAKDMTVPIRIHGDRIRKTAEKYGLKEDEIIDLSSNINFLGPSPKILEAINNVLNKITQYPDREYNKLRFELGEFLNVSPEKIVVSNGGIEIIYLISEVLRPRSGLVVNPTFSEYEYSLLRIGSKVRNHYLHPDDKFEVRSEEVINAMSGMDVVFLCSPNNPTGRTISKPVIEEIVDVAKRNGIYIIIDEAFMDFAREDGKSSVDLVQESNNLIILGSLTKFFAFPGLRLGYMVAHEPLAKKLDDYKVPWSVNIFAEAAGLSGLGDKEFIEKSQKETIKEREQLIKGLTSIKGFAPYCSETNFILIDVSKSGLRSSELTKGCEREGILIRDCKSFKGLDDRYIRIAVGNRKDNDRLIKTLKSLVLK